jgi:dipeptidyl aminopeptidase/acylaminoacyl peptidase
MNGFNVFSPDFSGSCGYGQKFVEDLLGKIGEKDTNEINQMIK